MEAPLQKRAIRRHYTRRFPFCQRPGLSCETVVLHRFSYFYLFTQIRPNRLFATRNSGVFRYFARFLCPFVVLPARWRLFFRSRASATSGVSGVALGVSSTFWPTPDSVGGSRSRSIRSTYTVPLTPVARRSRARRFISTSKICATKASSTTPIWPPLGSFRTTPLP